MLGRVHADDDHPHLVECFTGGVQAQRPADVAENSSGDVDTRRTSACRVSAQNRPIFSGCQCTGSSERSRSSQSCGAAFSHTEASVRSIPASVGV